MESLWTVYCIYFESRSLRNKTNWSILKTFCHGKNVSIILLLFIKNKFVTDFQEKANIFNAFFVKQCSPVPNSIGKKLILFQFLKKNEKQIVSNYRAVSLLPLCTEIFAKLIFNELFAFFERGNLLSKRQSGLRPGDSCIYQLLSITPDIFLSFDSSLSLETRGIFLDMSKVFDRVWNDVLLFKLKQNGVNGNPVRLIKSFLSEVFLVQRFTLNRKTSHWERIRAVVLQGSISGPLYFLVCINDLTTDLKSNVKLFADDTSFQ